MSDIAKIMQCVVLRNGTEIWIENERMENLKAILKNANTSKFIEIENEIINTSDIIGIFDAKTLEEAEKKKRGLWKCKYNKWHGKNDQCTCGMDILPKWETR